MQTDQEDPLICDICKKKILKYPKFVDGLYYCSKCYFENDQFITIFCPFDGQKFRVRRSAKVGDKVMDPWCGNVSEIRRIKGNTAFVKRIKRM